VQVVRAVSDGLLVDNPTAPSVTTAGNVVVTGPGTIVVREGWENAFSSAVGTAGQTAKTQVIFQVTGLPDNVALAFPASVASDTADGSFLVTLSGGAEVLTNQSTTNRVVYEFNESATSPSLLDSFSFTPQVSVTGQAGTGTAIIQAALGPIGAVTPNAQYPSTDVPRFAESFLPQANPVVTTVTALSVPVPAAVDSQNIALSNTASAAAVITVRARGADGTLASGIVNPASLNLAAHQTSNMSLKDLFGTSASSSNVSSVEFAAAANGLIANSIGQIGNKRFGIATPTDQILTFLPFNRLTSADVPILMLQNDNTTLVTAQISLKSSTGALLLTVSRDVQASGVLRESLTSLFSTAQNVPLTGYVTVRQSTLPLRAILLNNPNSSPDQIPSLAGTSTSGQTFPFFAFGSGYNSVLTLINTSDSQPVQVTLTIFDQFGTQLSKAAVRTLAPAEQQDFDFGALFALGSSNPTTTGYFSVGLDSTSTGLFSTIPVVIGALHITVGTLSSSVPFVGDSGTQYYLTPTSETTSTYTGISVLNTSGATNAVTVEAFNSAGASLGTITFNLASGGARIQLLRELIPQSLNQSNGSLRISSSGKVKVLGFQGNFDLSDLIYLRGETTPSN
jgi:hypothetical protein